MLTRISVRNWRAFDAAEIELRPGLNVLLGPNGAGKTSLLEAVAFVLAGEPASLANARLFVRTDGRPVQVQVHLQLGEGAWCVTRGLSAGGGRMHAALDRGGQRQAEGVEGVAAAIERELGAPADFFLRVLYMPEGDVYRFVEKPPLAAIDAHLRRIFGLEQLALIEQAAARVRREVKTERDHLVSLAQQALQRDRLLAEGRARWGDDPFAQQKALRARRDWLKDAAEAASARRRELDQAADRMQRAVRALAQLDQEAAALAGADPGEAVRAARQHLVALEQRLQEHDRRLAERRATREALATEGDKLRRRAPLDLAADDAALRARRDAVAATLREIDGAIAGASAALQAVRESTDFLSVHPAADQAEPVCPVCRQALPEPLRQRILAENAARERQLREEIAQLRARREAERAALEREAAALRDRLLAEHAEREREIAAEIGRLEQERGQLAGELAAAEGAHRAALERRRRLSEIAERRRELLSADATPADLAARAVEAQQALERAREEETAAAQALAEVQEQLATLQGYLQLLTMEGQAPALLEQRRLALARRELLAELFAAAAKASIDRLRTSALAAAYGEVARAWERFSGWTGVQLAAGPKGKLALQRPERALELAQLSGGERAAFLALLHAQLGRHFGRGGFLLLDEPLEHLDAENGRRLLEHLQQMCRDSLLTQVVLATVEAEVVQAVLGAADAHLVRLPLPAAARSA